MFEILGWLIILWLLGSTIYSTKFHLGNYFRSKDSDMIVAQMMDGPNHTEQMTKKDFLIKVLKLQLYKIIVIFILLYFLV
jgi:hypothetical protein